MDFNYKKYIRSEWFQFFDENNDELQDIFNKTITTLRRNEYYPKKKNIFKIFKYLAPSDIKVVLLGQDPYINYEVVDNKEIPQAHGLSFSVPKTHKKIPPSLNNMFKELKNCYPEFEYKNGNLKKWVKKEKIFLLNSALTVLPGNSNSHQKYWQEFTDKVIKYISSSQENIVFILMGNNAKSKYNLIDSEKHIIITSVHPSPLSATRGFFGSAIFKKTNDELTKRSLPLVNWNLNS